MIKKIYDKYKPDSVQLKIENVEFFEDLMKFIIPGTKIKLVGEKKKYQCVARSDNFIIIAKPFNLKTTENGEKNISIFDIRFNKNAVQ